MIRITKRQLPFLLNGRATTIHTDGSRYKHGRTYAAGIVHNRTICRVEILDATATEIRVRLANVDDPPRFLAARSEHGYTDKAARALPDEKPCDAVPAEYQKRLTTDARQRFSDQRADELERKRARAIGIRVKEAAKRGDRTAYAQLGHELLDLGQTDAAA